jgi:type IV pilus assembly protein PilC
MCGYIAIGERTANLPQVCLRLADYFETRAAAREELSSALMYPIIVSVMMLGVVLLAVSFVLPGYAGIFEASGVRLPAITAALLSAAEFFSQNTIAIFFIGFILILTMSIFFRTKKGRFFSAWFKLKIPILRKNINYNFVQALSLLLSSGLSVSEAIPVCSEISDNPILRKDLMRLSISVNSGVPFWQALAEIPYINPLIISLSRIGESTGALSQTIHKCNVYLEESFRREIRHLNKLLSPLLTLILGGLLAIVLLAIIVPTFELATAI